MNINGSDTFEHLIRLNRATNQAFILREFSHEFNNPLSSIQLAGELLKAYTEDINALLDEMNDEPERLPTGFQKECCSILENMPMLTQGICDSVIRLKQCTSWLSSFTGRDTITGMHGADLN
jgi:signal transduction histidine kinase